MHYLDTFFRLVHIANCMFANFPSPFQCASSSLNKLSLFSPIISLQVGQQTAVSNLASSLSWGASIWMRRSDSLDAQCDGFDAFDGSPMWKTPNLTWSLCRWLQPIISQWQMPIVTGAGGRRCQVSGEPIRLCPRGSGEGTCDWFC